VGSHFTSQWAWAPQETAHSPSHFTSHFELSRQSAVLRGPRRSLQSALLAHSAVEYAPTLQSHFEEESQITLLSSPPVPLHSELA
jgi:hypothetical protein